MILKQNPLQDLIVSVDLFLLFASESSLENPLFYEEKTGLIRFSTVCPPNGILRNRIPPLHRRCLTISESFLFFGSFLLFLFAVPRILGHARSHGRFVSTLPMSHVTFMTLTIPKGTLKVERPSTSTPTAVRLFSTGGKSSAKAGQAWQTGQTWQTEEDRGRNLLCIAGTVGIERKVVTRSRIKPEESTSSLFFSVGTGSAHGSDYEGAQLQAFEAGSEDGIARGGAPSTEGGGGNHPGGRHEGGVSAPGNDGNGSGGAPSTEGDPGGRHEGGVSAPGNEGTAVGDGSGSRNEGGGDDGGGGNDSTAQGEENTATQNTSAEETQRQEEESRGEEPPPAGEDPSVSHENAGKKEIAFGVGFGIQKSFARNVIKLSIKPTAVWEAQPHFSLWPDLKVLCMVNVSFGANEYSTPMKDGFAFLQEADLTLFDLKFACEKSNTIGQMGTSLSKVSVGGKPAQLLVRLGVDKLAQRVGFRFQPNPESLTYVMVGRVWGSQVAGHWQLQLDNPINLGTLTRDSGIPVFKNLSLRAGSVSLTKRFPNSLVLGNPLYQNAIRKMYKSLQKEIHILKELLEKETSPTEIKKLKEQIQRRHMQSREMLHEELKLKELNDLQPLRDFQPALNPRKALPVDSTQLPLQKILSLSPMLLTLASFAALCLNFLGNKTGEKKESNQANEIRLGKTSITNTLEASPVINISINNFREAQEQRSSSKALFTDGTESTESKIVDITDASVSPFQGTLPRTPIVNASLGIDAIPGTMEGTGIVPSIAPKVPAKMSAKDAK
jgi:hypothetical protein